MSDKKALFVVLFLIVATFVAYPFTSTNDNWRIYGVQGHSFFHEGKFESLITAIFTHGDEWHLFLNMAFLFVFGTTLATFIGWKKFLVVYFIGGVIGSLAWIFYSIIDKEAFYITAVGASGAIFAVMGALAIAKPKNAVDIVENSEILKFFPHAPWLIGIAYILVLGEGILGFIGIALYFIFVTALDLILGGATAHAAHLGGLLAGFVFGYLFKYKDALIDKKQKDNKYKKYKEIMPVHDYY